MENENLVTEEVTEDVVDTSTEENVEGVLTDTAESKNEENDEEKVKTYTKEEMEEIVQKRLVRQQNKLEKDYNKKLQRYKRTEEILNAGLGTTDIEDANAKLTSYYEGEGIHIPDEKPQGLTQRQIEILANAEADEIITAGDEEEELNRLLKLDIKDMTPTDKIIYKRLYEKVSDNSRKEELVKSGIDLSILDDKDFQSFEKKFSKDTKLSDVVELYKKINPTATPYKIGSMKSAGEEKMKDFYTPEEVQNLTQEEWEKPGIWEKVLASQAKWK